MKTKIYLKVDAIRYVKIVNEIITYIYNIAKSYKKLFAKNFIKTTSINFGISFFIMIVENRKHQILNDILILSTKLTNNSLKEISSIIKNKYPELTEQKIKLYIKFCCKFKNEAYVFISKNPIKIGNHVFFQKKMNLRFLSEKNIYG